ncbi:MAG: efflux RND transporter periplasmic adaptor subunit [Xanthomonadales bacterium]|nr:efflux RND transporter periplasmic adaptor subunit [Xanthomonadales bacterium]
MKKFLRFVAPIGVLLVGFGVVQAMVAAKPAPEKKEETQRLISLFYDEVAEEKVTLSVGTQGEVRSTNEIDLVPRVSGQIVHISDRFAVGAGFEPGETLIKIDDADYRLALTRAEARVAEAEVKLMQEEAAAAIKRQQWESIHKGKEPSPLQVNKPQVAEAKAKLRSAQADLAEARLNLERTEIRMPFHGRVMERHVGVGQFVSMGTNLGRVFSTDRIEVRLPLTDAQMAELGLPMGYVAKNGQGPVVDLSASAGGERRVWQGRIVRTDASVDGQTRLIYAVAEVEDPYGTNAKDGIPLAVGMFVTADIAGAQEQTAMVMPREALRSADKVYVINEEDKLEIRTVKVLSTSEELAWVTAGVAPGERVATSTIPNAVDGMLVQPINGLAQN